MSGIEDLIFDNLLHNDEYQLKVIPFLKTEYFKERKYQLSIDLIKEYFGKYNKFPPKEAIQIELSELKNIPKDEYDECSSFIASLGSSEKKDLDWLLEKTETFCQDNALYNALMESIQISNNDHKDLSKGAIPQILADALAVTFDTSIGHDFIDDADYRFQMYHKKENKIPFDIDILNKITNDGVSNKTLNIIMAGTGVGKSAAMCHMAAANLIRGYNVLYITLEMAEIEIARRIDANLLDIPLNDIPMITKSIYDKKINRLKETAKGKLIIKEYPTASAGVDNFRALLNELLIKQKFTPDIIYIDYINICKSSRVKLHPNMNSYTYGKMIAEEVRGLAGEQDLPIISATQVNRSGFGDSDFGLENTSESFGLPMTVDMMIGLISSEELEQLGQIMVKQLKNRYNDLNYYNRFVVGIDRSKMRLYDVEQSAQNDLIDQAVFDNGSFNEAEVERNKKFDKQRFNDFFKS